MATFEHFGVISNSSKEAHEDFVSGFHGSSPLDIIITLLPIVFSSVLASTFTRGKKYDLYCFLIEYLICIAPFILNLTIFNQISLELNALFIFFILIRMVIFQPRTLTERRDINFIKEKKISCLTSSRATVNVATVAAILAVDFHLFPRRFVKTETYGYSLMDVGAACYLFMNGITDSKKTVVTRQTLRDVFILLLLGLLRLISLRITNYQEHVTEYGVHCNFFFTLAIVKVVCVCLATKLPLKVKLTLCICIAVCHELALNSGLAEWTLSTTTRNDSLLSANREWIVSLPGNILIYLFGISTGNIIFSQYKNTSPTKIWILLPVVPFLLMFLLSVFTSLEPSRRLTNVPFVLWIVGLFLVFLTLYRAMELVSGQTSCQIFEAINSFPLLFFLLANLLTGVVNLSVNTLEVNDFVALIILNIYMLTLCYVSYFLKMKARKDKNTYS